MEAASVGVPLVSCDYGIIYQPCEGINWISTRSSESLLRGRMRWTHIILGSRSCHGANLGSLSNKRGE